METLLELGNRKIDIYGQTQWTVEGALDALYKGIDIRNINVDPFTAKQFNSAYKGKINPPRLNTIVNNSITATDYHYELSKKFNIPDEYKNLDLKTYVLDLCETEEEKRRVLYEFYHFDRINFTYILPLLVYIINTFIDNNLLWGVGRGSSVASYVLYKLGIHSINSLKYDIDFNEFIKDADSWHNVKA